MSVKKYPIFFRKNTGIQSFWDVVSDYFPATLTVGLCLARQIPTINIEHAAFSLFAEWLAMRDIKCKAMSLSVTRDAYHWKNEYKHSLAKIPLLFQNEGWHIQNRDILSKAVHRNIDGKILEFLQTIEGVSLPAYHYRLREGFFGSIDVTMNLSEFFIKVLSLCSLADCPRKPETVFREIYGREIEVPFNLKLFERGETLRPPASWHYVPYLMLFVSGERVLISTVDDDEEVTQWFDSAIKVIERVCDFGPLIIASPAQVEVRNFQSRLLEIPKRFLADNFNVLRSEITFPETTQNLFEVMEDFEKQIINLSEDSVRNGY